MSSFDTKYEVIPAKTGADRKTYKVGDKTMTFGGHNAFYIKDPGVAKALADKHGGQKHSESDEVRVMPVRNWRKDGIHSYSFSMAHMGNWKDSIDWGHD
jgi:hypothetical protein